jgi:hypothetical protein
MFKSINFPKLTGGNLVKFLFIALVFSACEKIDNYSKIRKDYIYQGAFSLPVGDMIMTTTVAIKAPYGWWLDSSIFKTWKIIQLEDELPFSFKEALLDTSKIDSLVFKLIILNYFPDTATFKISFTDSTGSVTDSLLSKPIVLPPAKTVVLPNNSTQPTYYVTIPHSRIANLGETKNLLLDTYINNYRFDSTVYKNYANVNFTGYSLSLRMGVRVFLKFNALQ